MKWIILRLALSLANAIPGVSSPLDLAWLNFNHGRYDDCLKFGRIASDMIPASADPHIALGRCEERLGNFANAHSHFATAISVESGNADALNNRALMSIKNVNVEIAKRELKEFAERCPSDERLNVLRQLIQQVEDHLAHSKMSIAETRRAIREMYLQHPKTNKD